MNIQSWFVRQKRVLGANIRETQSLLERIIAANHRSLLQNMVSFIGLFCKRDLWFYATRTYNFTLQVFSRYKNCPFIFLGERNLFVRGACSRKGKGQFLLRVFHFPFFSNSCSCCVSVPSREHDPFFSNQKSAVFAAWRDTQQKVPFFLENVPLLSKKTNMSIQSESADDRHSRMMKMFLINKESTLLTKSPHTLSRKVPYFGTYSWRSADDSHSIWRDMELTRKLENFTQRFYTIFPLGAIIIVIFSFMHIDIPCLFFLITGNVILEPLLKGLLAQIHMDLSSRGFGWNRTGDLQITHIIVWIIDSRWSFKHLWWLQHTATYCNTLQHAAIHCNTLKHTATVTHCF